MTTEHPDTSPASPELEVRAIAGSHTHWSAFDMKLEGARFHLLHELVSDPSFDEDRSKEVIAQIMAFARGYGDGQADSFLYEYGGMSEADFENDELASIRYDDLHRSYDELEYFENFSKSNRILSSAAATERARDILRNLTVDALNAFCAGRDGRLEESSPSVSPAP